MLPRQEEIQLVPTGLMMYCPNCQYGRAKQITIDVARVIDIIRMSMMKAGQVKTV